MATFSRKVDVFWNGGLMDGKGEAKAGTGGIRAAGDLPELRIALAGWSNALPRSSWPRRTPPATPWRSTPRSSVKTGAKACDDPRHRDRQRRQGLTSGIKVVSSGAEGGRLTGPRGHVTPLGLAELAQEGRRAAARSRTRSATTSPSR